MRVDPKRFIRTHRTKLLAAGGVVVGALALRARGKDRQPGNPAPTSYAPGGGGAGQSFTGAGGTYDSTASDIINTLQPQIEALTDAANRITIGNPRPAGDTTTPTPVPQPFTPVRVISWPAPRPALPAPGPTAQPPAQPAGGLPAPLFPGLRWDQMTQAQKVAHMASARGQAELAAKAANGGSW